MYKHIISLATLLAVLAPIWVQHAIAYPSTPPSGGYSGWIFSQYFRNIIESDGSPGTTSSGICPDWEMIWGFDTSPARYGMPICVSAVWWEVLATGFSGTLMGTENYVTKYAAGWSGLTNSRFFDNGLNIGLDTLVPMAKLDIVGNIRIADGTQGSGKVLVSDNTGIAQWQHLPADLPVGAVMAFNSTTCPAWWAIADGVNGPDLRGEFIRGLDSGRGVDGGRILGDWQAPTLVYAAIWPNWLDQAVIEWPTANTSTLEIFQNWLRADPIQDAWYGTWFKWFNSVTSATAYTANSAWRTVNTAFNRPINTSNLVLAWGSRPRNIALLYCIKVTSANATLSSDVTWMNMDGTTAGNVVLATTGNVWVGTTTPPNKFSIFSTTNINAWSNFANGLAAMSIDDGVAWLMFDANQIEQRNPAWGVVINHNSPSHTVINQGWGNTYINPLGWNVGIWNTAPSYKLHVTGSIGVTGGYYYASDISLKSELARITSPLERILRLNGYTFAWKDSGAPDMGLVAQEVEEVFPSLVNTDDDGIKSVKYANLVAPIIEAIRELSSHISSVHTSVQKNTTEIERLRMENAILKSRIDKIEKQLAQ